MRLCSTSSPARRSSFASGISVSSEIGIVIELPPAHRIEVAEQAGGVVVPAPPQIARQRPEPLLRGRDEAVERARFAHHRRHLRGGLRQHADLVFAESPRLHGLHHQNALQHAAVDQRHAQKRLVGVFAGFPEILEARMVLDLLHGDRAAPARPPGRPGLRAAPGAACRCTRGRSPTRRGQHQVGAVRLQQVGRADIGLKPPGDQRHHVHQRLGRLAASLGKCRFLRASAHGCRQRLRHGSFVLPQFSRFGSGATGQHTRTTEYPIVYEDGGGKSN